MPSGWLSGLHLTARVKLRAALLGEPLIKGRAQMAGGVCIMRLLTWQVGAGKEVEYPSLPLAWRLMLVSASAAAVGGAAQPRARRVLALRLQVDWALMLKLAFVIVLLGQDASHRRLYGLVAGGVALYMALSGRLTGILAWVARAAPSPGRMAAALAPGGWVPDAGTNGGGGGGGGGAAVAGGGQATGLPTARMLGVCVYALIYGLVCSLVPAWRAEEIRGVADWWRAMAQQRAQQEGVDVVGAPAMEAAGEGGGAEGGHAHQE